MKENLRRYHQPENYSNAPTPEIGSVAAKSMIFRIRKNVGHEPIFLTLFAIMWFILFSAIFNRLPNVLIGDWGGM